MVIIAIIIIMMSMVMIIVFTIILTIIVMMFMIIAFFLIMRIVVIAVTSTGQVFFHPFVEIITIAKTLFCIIYKLLFLESQEYRDLPDIIGFVEISSIMRVHIDKCCAIWEIFHNPIRSASVLFNKTFTLGTFGHKCLCKHCSIFVIFRV